MKYYIFTIDGKELLEQYIYKKAVYSCNGSEIAIKLCGDLIKSTKLYNSNALFAQIKKHLISVEGDLQDSKELFTELLLYVDFSDAFPLKDKSDFFEILENGILFDCLRTDENGVAVNKRVRYVPFEKSQSQAKKCVISFVREDLFAPVRRRLNLDIDFEKDAVSKKLAYLSKLYAYRGLYLSESKEIFNSAWEEARSFFDENNVVVLKEIVIENHDEHNKVQVYTSEPTGETSENGEVMLKPEVSKEFVDITCFDGEGLISPRLAEKINEKIGGEKPSYSFQVRMPFFKGMLHTVDFHSFLKDAGVEGKAVVKDVFGRERDLFKANIIVTPSMFKLCSLSFHKLLGDTDPMKYYFEKVREYEHGFYLVKTENSFHNTGYTHLTTQFLSTLDLTAEDFDEIVREHIQRADAFKPENLDEPEKIREILGDSQTESWMKLLLADSRFIYDTHIRKLLANHRISKYNNIALGRFEVRGENRFLSGDLFYFLIRLIKEVIAYRKKCGEDITALSQKERELSLQRIKRRRVYMPGFNKANRVALLRSPHLSRNEDVGAYLASAGEYYQKYLSHLTGVVFVGDRSYIPQALGGADFDGDHVNVIYDKRIADACFRGGYAEGERKSKPFILINPLSAANGENCVTAYNYVSPLVIYNTFSSRIGEISNTALKLAAVEYDRNIESPFDCGSAFCTILTGNEIDAAKKGVRPYIDVVDLRANKNKEVIYITEEVTKYINIKGFLESRGGIIPDVKRNGEKIEITDKDFGNAVFEANRDKSIVTQLLYRWADAFIDFSYSEFKPLAEEKATVLNGIFNIDNKSQDIIGGTLWAYKKIRKNFIFNQKRRSYLTVTSDSNQAKIKVLMKGQYDDIYSADGCEKSYSEQCELLQKQIVDVVNDGYELSDLVNLKKVIFSESKEVFDAESFWPYSYKKATEQFDAIPLFKSLSELKFFGIVKNFNYEGYKIFNYILDNAIKSIELSRSALSDRYRREEDEAEQEAIKNPVDVTYMLELKEIADDCFKKRTPVTLLEKRMADKAKKELCKAMELKTEENYASEIIRSIYPVKAVLNETFWKVFSVNEVLRALGDDEYVK